VKRFFLRCIILFMILLFLHTIVYAKSPKNKDEFFEIFSIANKKAYEKTDVYINKVINLFRDYPNSLDAYFISCSLDNIIDANDNYKQVFPKFEELYKKYYDTINNLDTDTSEKVLLSYMLTRGFSFVEGNEEEMEKNSALGYEILNNIKNNCINDNYKALAILLIANVNPDLTMLTEFKDKYPNNSALPGVEFSIVDKLYAGTNETQFINELLNLKKIHYNVESPFGHKFYIHLYSSIVFAYMKLNDINNAKIYFELIKSEAPNYWNIQTLEKFLGESTKNKSLFNSMFGH